MPRYDYTVSFHEARKTYVSFGAAVLIPTGISLVIGIASGVTIGSIAWAMDADNPLQAATIGAGASALFVLISALRFWREMVISIEAAHIASGNPSIAMNPIKVQHVTGQGGKQSFFTRLPGTQYQHLAVAKLFLSGVPLSIRSMSKIFTQAEAQAYIAKLIEYDYARYRNSNAPTRGIEVTPLGESVFRSTVQQFSSTPLPQPVASPKYTGRLYSHNSTHTEYDDGEEEDA